MTESRLNTKYIFLILSFFAVSFVLSLFLMQLLGGIIFLFWLIERNNEKIKAIDVITLSVILFGAVRLLSIFFSNYPSISYHALYKEALFYLALISVSFYLKTLDRQSLLRLVHVFIVGAVIISIIGIVRFVSGDVQRAESFSSGYMVYSTYLLVAFAIALFFPKELKKAKYQFYWATIYCILITGILASLGRANAAIAILLLAVATGLRKLKLRQILIIALLLITLALIYIYSNPGVIETRVENITGLSDRDIIWKGAQELLTGKPILGYGPRTFREIFPFIDQFEDKGIGSWHNDFLQIYFESGLLGLFSFLMMLFVIYRISIRQIFSKQLDKDLKKLSGSVLAAITGLLLSSLTSGFITSVVLSIVFVFLLAVLSRIEIENKRSTN